MQRTSDGLRLRGRASSRLGIGALAAVALAFASGHGFAQTFQQARTFDAGLRPPAVAIGDFNEDGKKDLAVADSGSNRVSILLGDGHGAYGAPASFLVGSFPRALAVADLNGDAHLDLAVANFGSNNVSILLGDGTGSLDVRVDFGVAQGPFGIVTADFNGDGDADLAVTNSSSNNVSILLGDGDGGFSAASNYGAGNGPRGLAVGDFNGNGNVDLVIANSGNVSILLGDGLGGFGPRTVFAAGQGPYAVAVAKLDGGATLDLVVANDDSNDVSILLGNGAGGFGVPTQLKAGFRPHAVVLGDFNSDGKQDLAVTNFGSNTVSVRLGNGAGSFGVASHYGAGTAAFGLALADLNGDNKPDLAVANFLSDNVSILIGGGNGKFDAASAYDVGASPTSLAVGDFNEDGRPDAVAADSGANDVAVLLGTVSGGLAQATFFAAGGGPSSVGVGNFNGGGHLDLAVTNSQDDEVSVLLSNGPGSFASPVDFPVGQAPRNVAVGDLNGDAKPDLAVANFDSDDTSILLGDGDGGFMQAGGPGVGDKPSFVVIGNFNADRHPDLAVANMGSDDVTILLGDGTGGFDGGLRYPVATQPRGLALGDFNQDGNTDLAVASLGANRVSILFGDGLGAFDAASNYLVGGGPTSVVVGDFNGDSHQDLAVATSIAEHVSILSGNGHGVFAPTQQVGVGRGAMSVVVGDFNKDGKADLAVANQDSDSVWLLLNTTIFEKADLDIDKDDGQTETAPGAPISYAIVVTNHGPHTVTSLTVTDDLPPEIQSPVFTPETGSYDSQTGEWTGLSLASGQSVTLTLDGTVDPDAATDIVNTVTVEPPIGVGDPVPGNNSDSDTDALFSLSVDDQTLTEVSGGTMTFHVSLNGASAQTVTVSYTTVDGSADAGSDYTAVAGSLTFPPGTLARTVSVPVLGDLLSEVNETFFVELSGPTGANIGDGHGLGTIVDDDPPPSLAIGNVSVAEGNAGNTPAAFTVSLSTPSGQAVTVDYATVDGSGQAGSDYTAAFGTLTIPAGAPSGTLTVQLHGDVAQEPNETFFVALSNATAATIADGLGQGNILDDDSPPRISVNDVQVVEIGGGTLATFTVALSAPSSFVVTVDYATDDGTATAGADYTATSGTLTFAPSEMAQPVIVPILSDAALESTEHYFVNLSDPSNGTVAKGHGQGWIIDQSAGQRLHFGAATYSVAETKANANVTVNRVGPKTGVVTVDYEASDGTAVSGQDYTAVSGTLTFNSGVGTRTFMVAITNDTIVDGGGETVMLTLSNPTGVGVLGAPPAAMLTITDNDLGGKLSFSAATYSVGESGPVATLTVKRSNGTASGVTVAYATSDGTAEAGSDYTASSGTLTFEAGVTSQTLTVPILEDALAEGDETFSVTLSAPGGGGTLGVPSAATVTIAENESTLQLSSASYSIGEAGSATITVKRSGSKSGVVTVDYATADGTAAAGSDYTGSAGVLTFPKGIGVKTFKVPIIADTVQEGSESFSVGLTNPTGGAALGRPSSAAVSIADNDVAGVLQFSAAAYSVSELKTSVTITVKRVGGGKASGVTVDYATSDGTGVAGVDYVATSGTLAFGANIVTRTFTVTILNDGVAGSDETVNLTLSNPQGGGSLGVPAAAVLTILSDDPILQFNAATYSVGEQGPVATITVQRLGLKAPSVTVDYATSDGTATAGSDYTPTSGTLSFGPNVVTRTFTVPIADDTQVEPTETVLLAVSNPSGGSALGARRNAVLSIVTDNPMLEFSATEYSGTEKSGKATITVNRVGPKTGSVTVNYATSNGTGFAGADYAATSGVLTFASGVVKKTFVITIINDTLSEPPETVNLTLSGPGGGSFLGPNSAAVLAITSDDSGGSLQLSASSYNVSELGPAATITVTRSGGTASGVTVDYAATPGTAVANVDFVATSGTLVFDSGELSKTFTVLALNDEVADGNKTVNLQLSNPGAGGTLEAQSSSVLWIVDWP